MHNLFRELQRQDTSPSGGYLSGASGAGASFNLSPVTLGTTGTYTVTTNPTTTATGSLNLQVTNP